MEWDKDIEEMTVEELKAYLAFLEDRLTEMDDNMPPDEMSDDFSDWAERHEELEDLYDEATERLEDLRGE